MLTRCSNLENIQINQQDFHQNSQLFIHDRRNDVSKEKEIMLRTCLIENLQLTNRKIKLLFYQRFDVRSHIQFQHFVYISFLKFIVLI